MTQIWPRRHEGKPALGQGTCGSSFPPWQNRLWMRNSILPALWNGCVTNEALQQQSCSTREDKLENESNSVRPAELKDAETLGAGGSCGTTALTNSRTALPLHFQLRMLTIRVYSLNNFGPGILLRAAKSILSDVNCIQNRGSGLSERLYSGPLIINPLSLVGFHIWTSLGSIYHVLFTASTALWSFTRRTLSSFYYSSCLCFL